MAEPATPISLPLADSSAIPLERASSTMSDDGTRRWMYPELAKGPLWQARRIVGVLLAAIFITMPHTKINGKPPILLDIAQREFTLWGTTFLPTDTLLLSLGALISFFSIVLATALIGRVWCGWGCPQTVYMEFLFRPIDRFFEGTVGKGGKPKRKLVGGRRIARWLVYLVVCMFLAHTFLSYFVGVDALATWLRTPPWEHPTAFLVMATTTILMMYHFLFFREQLCVFACPYGRLQSVMLDRESIVVAYDHRRGEPRSKGKRIEKGGKRALEAAREANPHSLGLPIVGDCVDCYRCVAVCPTGIDIRDGLQLECVNCAQCIDVCNEVMRRVGLPQGLIRYDSENAIRGLGRNWLRLRTFLYPLILVILCAAFVMVLGTKYAFDAHVTRAPGHPFTRLSPAEVRNTLRLRLVNRTDQPQTYQVNLAAPQGVRLQLLDAEPLLVAPGQSVTVPVVLDFGTRLTAADGKVDAQLKIVDQSENERTIHCRLLGPTR